MSKRWNWIIFLVFTLVVDVLGIFISDKFFQVINRTTISVTLYYVFMGCLVASALFCFFIVFVLLREKDESVSPPVNVPVKVDVPLSPPVDVPIVEEIPPNVEDVSMYEQPLEQQGYDDSIVEDLMIIHIISNKKVSLMMNISNDMIILGRD